MHARQAREELERDSAQRFAEVAAKAQARIDNPRVASATLHAVSSSPSGEPLLASESQVAEFGKPERLVTAWVENFYTTGGRRFLPLHLLYGADGDGVGAIRRIVERAAEAYNGFFSNGEGITHDGVTPWQPSREIVPVAIATSRPGHRWPLRNENSFESVAELVKFDLHCDFDLFAATELGSCVDRLGHVADLFTKSHPTSGREYIEKHFSTVVFARGDLCIFARICEGCYQSFLYRNNVEAGKVEIIEPWSDGFGSVPRHGIGRSEYLWPGRLDDGDRDE
jgi:hypothetical protein